MPQRGATNDYQMIISFVTPVTVNLTGVTNVQRITVTLFNVNDGTTHGSRSRFHVRPGRRCERERRR